MVERKKNIPNPCRYGLFDLAPENFKVPRCRCICHRGQLVHTDPQIAQLQLITAYIIANPDNFLARLDHISDLPVGQSRPTQLTALELLPQPVTVDKKTVALLKPDLDLLADLPYVAYFASDRSTRKFRITRFVLKTYGQL